MFLFPEYKYLSNMQGPISMHNKGIRRTTCKNYDAIKNKYLLYQDFKDGNFHCDLRVYNTAFRCRLLSLIWHAILIF